MIVGCDGVQKLIGDMLYFSWKILNPFSLASMGSYTPSLSYCGNVK